tara:strand:- start:10417 stop:11979 length:1563 start_codon:yes stop_codon:yes gene_type:complete
MAFPASTTTVSNVLKQGYEGPIRNQINREALIYQLFSEGPHSWEGNTIIIPTHVGGVASTAITYSSETAGANRAALTSIGAVASSQQYGKFIVDSAYLYAAFMVTGQAMAKAPQQAGENADAFIGAMWSEMNGLQRDIKNKLNTDMFTGHGAVAFLVDQGGSGAGTHVNRVVSGTNKITAGATTAAGDTFRIVHVPRDPAADWALLNNAVGGTLATSFLCTAKDEYNGTCTLVSLSNVDAAVAGNHGPDASGVGDTEICVMVKGNSPAVCIAAGEANAHLSTTITPVFLDAGVANAQATASRECVGLNALAFLPNSAGAFSNDRHATNNTILRGQGFKTTTIGRGAGVGGYSAGNQLDLEDVQLVMDGLAELVEGYPTDCLIMHRFTRAEFLRIIQASREVMGINNPGATNQNAPGYVYEPGTDLVHEPGGLNYHGIPIKISKDVPLGCIYLLNRDSINTYTLKSGSFETFHNGEVITQVRNGAGDFVDAKEGFWKQYFQLVSECPRAIGVIAGIKYKKA